MTNACFLTNITYLIGHFCNKFTIHSIIFYQVNLQKFGKKMKITNCCFENLPTTELGAKAEILS